MFIFAHAGIALGTAVLLNAALSRRRISSNEVNGLEPRTGSLSEKRSPKTYSQSRATTWLTSLANRVDIRVLLIGSLLPDIIDKPIGQYLFRDTFSNGRIFSHTLLFLTLISLGGLLVYWRGRKTWLLALAFGTLIHLVLDVMWLTPRTFLWPLYGFSFGRIDLSHWIQDMLDGLLNQPVVVLPELAGAIVIGWFLWLLFRRGTVRAFLRSGRV